MGLTISVKVWCGVDVRGVTVHLGYISVWFSCLEETVQYFIGTKDTLNK